MVEKNLDPPEEKILKKPITKSVTYKAPGNSESCEAYIPFFENG